MGYSGQICTLPLANGGLHTDDPSNKIPPSDLIRAINVQYYNGLLEKEAGSARFNSAALPAGIAGIFDWWPNDISQRLISVCKDGKVYRHTLGALPAVEMTASDSSPATLTVDNQTVMVAGGNEVTANSKKLFIFTQSIPQVITGDGITRRRMSLPALDWSGQNQPFFGIIHRSSLFCFGNRNNPHMVYKSSTTNHEDFQSGTAAFFPCYSGEGERLISATVYKGALFVTKYPSGVYQLIDTDPSSANWYFTKINDELGGASQHCFAPVINDVFLGNSNGSISSASAVLSFGNLKTGEILYALRNEKFMREETIQQGSSNRHCIYYSDKKLFMATYQSAGGTKNDRILYIDMNFPQALKVSWSSKDQPNCLSLRKDSLGIKRPMYGAEDGYIYLMDQADRLVGSTGYDLEFQTPYLDFNHLNPALGDQNKLYDFLEVDFEPTGDYDLTIEVYVDGKFIKTIPFNLSGVSNLDSFILDQNNTDPEVVGSDRKPIQVSGRSISFKGYSSSSGENVRLTGLNVYFRPSAQQKGGKENQ